MTTNTRTVTVSRHYITVDGQEFETTFPADEYIAPRVDTDEGGRVTLTYAHRDEFASGLNPREDYDHAGVMVRVRDGYGGILIDEPDSDIARAFEIANEELRHLADDAEIFYVVKCGCWTGHDLENVGECPLAYEAVIVAREDDVFPDGSTLGAEISLDDTDGLDRDGVSAMLDAWREQGSRWPDPYAVVAAYVKAGRPDVTAFQEWQTTGYSQSHWAEGYIYTTDTDLTDPAAALDAEVREYEAWANGDVYMVVQEMYAPGEDSSDDYESVGGFYGSDYTEQAIAEGSVF